MIRVDLSDGAEERLWREHGPACLFEVARRFPGATLSLEGAGPRRILIQDGALAHLVMGEERLRPLTFGTPGFLFDAQMPGVRTGPALAASARPMAAVQATSRHLGPVLDRWGETPAGTPVIVDTALRQAMFALVLELSYPPGVVPVAGAESHLEHVAAKLAAVLAWSLFLLAIMPELQKYLRSGLPPFNPTSGPTLAELDQCVDLIAFQREVLRLFPPLPVLGRLSEAHCSISTLDLLPNDEVIVSVIGLHHDPRFFPKPAEVRLDRFRQPLPPEAGFMPYGVMDRACDARMQSDWIVGAALAILLSRIQVDIADQAPLDFHWTGVLSRRNGHSLLLRLP